jgi:hypothetical protein
MSRMVRQKSRGPKATENLWHVKPLRTDMTVHPKQGLAEESLRRATNAYGRATVCGGIVSLAASGF